jgi:hypothetical protein
MCNRNILDQEGYHIACGQHHSYSKAPKAPLKVAKLPVTLVCWAMARFPRSASKATEVLRLAETLLGWLLVHSWRGHRHRGETTVQPQYLG